MVQETVVEGLRRDVNGSCNDLHDAEQAGGISMMEKMREHLMLRLSTDLQEGGYDGTNAERNQVVSSQAGGGFGSQ